MSGQRREDRKPRAASCLGVTRPRRAWMHSELTAFCPTRQGCRAPVSSEAGCPVPSCPPQARPLKCVRRAEPDAVSSTGHGVGRGCTGPERGLLQPPPHRGQQGARLGHRLGELPTSLRLGFPMSRQGARQAHCSGLRVHPQGGAQGALATTVTQSQASQRLTNKPKVEVTATAGRKSRPAAPRGSSVAALPLWVLCP